MTSDDLDDRAYSLAQKLTTPQRRWIKDATPSRRSAGGWFTYPPTNTCVVLHRRGLWEWTGELTRLGADVRFILKHPNMVSKRVAA